MKEPEPAENNNATVSLSLQMTARVAAGSREDGLAPTPTARSNVQTRVPLVDIREATLVRRWMVVKREQQVTCGGVGEMTVIIRGCRWCAMMYMAKRR